MKKLSILLLLVGINMFSQTFEVVNKGYYYGKVGDTILPNRTTDLKALTDVQEYLDKNNLELGEVVRPPLEVKRKKTISHPHTIIIRDTIYISNGEILIGNQWMGEPIIEVPKEAIYGLIITDSYGHHNLANSPENAFDGDINTYSSRNAQSQGWIGQDYGQDVTINRFRFLPRQVAADAIKMNEAVIQYLNENNRWTTIYTISGITESNFTEWIDVTFEPVTAEQFRLLSPQERSYNRVAELEFYKLSN